MEKILNTWTSKSYALKYYELDEHYLLAQSGPYKAYKLPSSCLYTYKGVAITERVRFSLEVFNLIQAKENPITTKNEAYFLYERANENKIIGLNLLNNIKA